MQAAVRLDHFQPRPQVEMEGVAEDDLRADRADLLRQHALDRAIGADRHARRCLDHTAGEGEAAAARADVGGPQFDVHAGHSSTASPSVMNRSRSPTAGPYRSGKRWLGKEG